MILATETTSINSIAGSLWIIGLMVLLIVVLLLYTVLMERRDRLQDAHWRYSAHRIGEYPEKMEEKSSL